MQSSLRRVAALGILVCSVTLVVSAVVVSAVHAGPVTWTLQPGGSYTFAGETTFSTLPTIAWPNQTANSVTSALSGSFTTTNTFRTSIDFGDSPGATKPKQPDVVDDNNPTPEELAALDAYASVTLPTWAQSNLGVVYANSDNASPGVMPYFWNVTTPFPDPAAEPAVFGVNVNTPFQPAGQPIAFRDNRNAFFTNKTDPNVTYGDDAVYFPNGAPVNPATGQFDAAAAGIYTYTNLDARLTDLSYVGRVPTTGEDGNVSTTPGVIGRDGPAWTISLPLALFTFLVDPSGPGANDRHDRIDFPGDIDVPGDPSTYKTGLYLWAGGSGSLTAVANILPGDVNFDGTVNIFDINLISANWSGSTVVGNLTPGDANGDGIVNIFDINLVSSNWGASGGGGAGLGGASAVPEPAGAVLAVLGATVGLLALARRRRVSR